MSVITESRNPLAIRLVTVAAMNRTPAILAKRFDGASAMTAPPPRTLGRLTPERIGGNHRSGLGNPPTTYAEVPTATPGAPGISSGHTGSRSASALAIWRAMTSRWISLAPS